MSSLSRAVNLERLLTERILLLDGAMGTMIQRARLAEEDYRGARFRDWARELRGNNDLLSLTQARLIRDIHTQYLQAGADIIETNTFNSTAIALADYGMESLARELNRAAAELAVEAAREWEEKSAGKPRFVAGVLGPTNKTASLSPDVNDPGFRAVSFDALVAAYGDAIEGLLEGGVDLLARDGECAGIVAREDQPREGLRPGDVGALADVDEKRLVIDVERLHAREPQCRRTRRRRARRHTLQGVTDRRDVLRRRAAAAAGDVDPPAARPFAELARHRLGRVFVFAEGIRQPGVRMAGGEALGKSRQLLDVLPQLLRAERAIEADGDRTRMAHRVVERFGRLA